MRLVIVESPYAASSKNPIVAFFQRWRNKRYARACVRDSLHHDEAPIASHLLYTQPGILDDKVPSERKWGIEAGLAWRKVAEMTVVYRDHGISPGMEYGIADAERCGRPIEYRRVGDWF